MQEDSQRIRTLGYNLQTASSHLRTDPSLGESSGLGMGSGGATNGGPSDRGFTLNSSSEPSKKTMPANGKKTKGRVKIKMEFIDNKLRRYTTFSKRKTGIMKKAYELSTLTGTQVMLLVASETGHVYTFATRKLQPMITSEAGKALIQTCLNSPDPPPEPGSSGLDQRMSATGFEETDLTYTVGDDCEKMVDGRPYSSSPGSPNSGDEASPSHLMRTPSPQMVHLAVDKGDPQRQQVSNNNTPFTTILTTAPGGGLTPALQIGGFQSSSDSSGSAASTFRLPTQNSMQPFFTIAGSAKNTSTSTSTNPQSSTPSAISVVQSSQPNLSLLSGNVMIPAHQTLLQPGNTPLSGNNVGGAFMYHTSQGLMYATSSSIPEGVILNLGQEQGGQQYISIPVTLSLTPSQRSVTQLIQSTSAIGQSSGGSSSSKKDKFKK